MKTWMTEWVGSAFEAAGLSQKLKLCRTVKYSSEVTMWGSTHTHTPRNICVRCCCSGVFLRLHSRRNERIRPMDGERERAWPLVKCFLLLRANFCIIKYSQITSLLFLKATSVAFFSLQKPAMPLEKLYWSCMVWSYDLISPMPLVCAAFCVSSKANLDLRQVWLKLWGFTKKKKKNEALFLVRLNRIKLTKTYILQKGHFFLPCVNGIKNNKEKRKTAGWPAVGSVLVIQALLVLRRSHLQRRKWKQE